MVSPVSLRALSAFEATARHTSVARAANEMGISSSAVSQQISWLESHLKRQLFERSKRPMVLSEYGERLYDAVTGPLSDIDNALNRLEPASVHSTLSIRTSPSLTANWLIRNIGAYRRLFPHVELRFEAINEDVGFDWSGFDLDIRSGYGNWPGLFSYPLLDEEIIPLCSPRYLEEQSIDLNDLSGHTLIHTEKSPISWTQWFQQNEIRPEREPYALRLDRSFLSIDAAKHGLGIALESTFLAATEIRSGELVPAFGDLRPIRIQQHWLVCPHQRLRIPKNEGFIIWLWQTLPEQWRTTAPKA